MNQIHDQKRLCRPRSVGKGVALLTCVILTLVGCSDTEPTPVPESDEPTTAPTSTQPAWQDKYSDKQLATYEAALDRWTEYETKSEPIWAAGKATPEAEKFFEEYYPSPIWQDLYRRLETFDQNKIKTVGLPKTLWSKAANVTTVSVKIKQCLDYTPVKNTLAGEWIKSPTPKPQLRTIDLKKPAGYDWLIYNFVDLVDGKPTPCKP